MNDDVQCDDLVLMRTVMRAVMQVRQLLSPKKGLCRGRFAKAPNLAHVVDHRAYEEQRLLLASFCTSLDVLKRPYPARVLEIRAEKPAEEMGRICGRDCY